MSEEKDKVQKLNINDIKEHQKWLINNGFINDMHKDQFYLFGAILHKEIVAVELDLELETKTVEYKLYVPSSFFNKLDKFNKLSQSEGIFGLWRFKNMLKKEGNLNFTSLVNVFIKDYCGPQWNAKIKILDVKDYEDGYTEIENTENRSDDKQSDS